MKHVVRMGIFSTSTAQDNPHAVREHGCHYHGPLLPDRLTVQRYPHFPGTVLTGLDIWGTSKGTGSGITSSCNIGQCQDGKACSRAVSEVNCRLP
jgi:hypothetical protein